MDTIGDKVEYIGEIKGAIRGAIEGKGVDVPEGTPFMAYADKVGEISGTGGGHTILDGEGNALPQQPALQFTGNVSVADGEGATVVEVGSKQPGQIIGVWGTLERRAFAANTWTKIKMIPTDGDIGTINENGDFVAPESGAYDLCAFFGRLNAVGTNASGFSLNSPDNINAGFGFAQYGSAYSSAYSNFKTKLFKGDVISCWVSSTVAQTKQTSSSQFTITLDTSINLTVWDAYETWKSLDPENANVSYDEWMFGGIRNSAYDIWQEQNTGTEQAFLKWLRVGGFSPTNIGEIFWWPLSAPPTDSLYCDGRAIDRIEYADLFAVIGATFGEGDGDTTFNLPDLRGEFIRGYDPEAVRDPDGAERLFGSHQDGLVESHVHGTKIYNSSSEVTGYGLTKGAPFTDRAIINASFYNRDVGESYGGAETRPTNINLLPCIRYTASFTTVELSKLKNFLATLPE